jgi:ABC-type sugar transport system, permease component
MKYAGLIARTMILAVIAALFLVPLVFTIADSFMSESEIVRNYGMVASSEASQVYGADRYAALKFIPDTVTIRQYYTVLVKRLKFLLMFWNSVKLVLPIVLGQAAVASMAAYAFSRLNFRGRDTLFLVYIIVMMMPFQVTLVPNYIVADKLGLIGNCLSIILPGIFGTFGVFLLRQFMSGIPDSYCESARVDGAGHLVIFTRIVLPLSKAGLAALSILLFIDNWNMVEQPLIFLQNADLQPLSLFLSDINAGERGIAFAASAVYMMPMLLMFSIGSDYLVEGIQLSGLKG